MEEAVSARSERARTRKALRRARRALAAERRAAAERSLAARLQSLAAWRRARSVAVYLSFDGEPSLQRVADAAARQGKQVYAPVVVRNGLVFAPVARGARLRANRFGIAEPAAGAIIDPRALDLVLTPLVAFDPRGTRLGMGLGYYDRAFRFLRHRRCWTRPKLIGVAYSFQKLSELPRQPWDIPLWGAVTETEALRFTSGAA